MTIIELISGLILIGMAVCFLIMLYLSYMGSPGVTLVILGFIILLILAHIYPEAANSILYYKLW